MVMKKETSLRFSSLTSDNFIPIVKENNTFLLSCKISHMASAMLNLESKHTQIEKNVAII